MKCPCTDWTEEHGCHDCRKCAQCCNCRVTKEELIEHLIAVTVQGCSSIYINNNAQTFDEKDGICSNSISAYADSIKLLAKLGALEIIVERSDYVTAVVFDSPRQS